MSNWPQTTRAFIRTKLYSVYVMDYLPYFVFFLHLKKLLNRNRTPSCSAVTEICRKSLWLSLLCQEGIQKPTWCLMYHDCDRGIQKPTQCLMHHDCDRGIQKPTQWLMYHDCDRGIQKPIQCLMHHDCDRGIQRTAQRYYTKNDFNVSWLCDYF